MHKLPNQTAALLQRDTSPSAAAVAFGGLIALAVAMGIGRFAFTPLLPMMQDDAGLSVAGAGWLASANYAGYLLGAVSAIRVRLRPAAAVRGGLVATGLATFMMGAGMIGAGHGFAAWIVLRAVAGFTSAWVLIFASAWCLARLAPFGRPILTGTVFAGVGAGIAVTGVLCMVLMRVQAGSVRTWEVLGIIALALTAAIWPVFRADGDAGGSGRSGGADGSIAAAALRSREAARLILCYGVFGFGYILPATFLPAMARQAIQDPAVFGWSWPVFGAAALISTLAATSLRPTAASDRRLWALSHLAMAVGVALPAFLHDIAAIMLAALLVGGTFMVATMAGMQEARAVAGRDAAAGLIAAMTAAFAAGQIAGPLFAGAVVASGFGLGTALLAASFLLVASACALLRGGGDGQ